MSTGSAGTGRAGKSGKAITICSGRRQVGELLQIGRMVKTSIARADIPKPEDIRTRQQRLHVAELEALLAKEEPSPFTALVEELMQQGHDPAAVAAAALQLHYGGENQGLEEIQSPPIPPVRPAAIGKSASTSAGTSGSPPTTLWRLSRARPA